MLLLTLGSAATDCNAGAETEPGGIRRDVEIEVTKAMNQQPAAPDRRAQADTAAGGLETPAKAGKGADGKETQGRQNQHAARDPCFRECFGIVIVRVVPFQIACEAPVARVDGGKAAQACAQPRMIPEDAQCIARQRAALA